MHIHVYEKVLTEFLVSWVSSARALLARFLYWVRSFAVASRNLARCLSRMACSSCLQRRSASTTTYNTDVKCILQSRTCIYMYMYIHSMYIYLCMLFSPFADAYTPVWTFYSQAPSPQGTVCVPPTSVCAQVCTCTARNHVHVHVHVCVCPKRSEKQVECI